MLEVRFGTHLYWKVLEARVLQSISPSSPSITHSTSAKGCPEGANQGRMSFSVAVNCSPDSSSSPSI